MNLLPALIVSVFLVNKMWELNVNKRIKGQYVLSV